MLARITHKWSFPPGGNVLYKPLDSGFRRNDDGSGINPLTGSLVQLMRHQSQPRNPRLSATSADTPEQRHLTLQPASTAILRPMQPQPTFDTQAFVKRLTRAGMPEDQAEILAKGQADLYERLVTKEYFEFTLKHELEKLRAELKHDIEKLSAELKRDIKEMEHKLTIKLGAFLGISVTILAALTKFF